MLEELIIAGFGGQGIMFLGEKILCPAGLLEGKNVAWMPSYGPEMRGGTANCSVIISSEEIDSIVIDVPGSIIIMNKPSLAKFGPKVRPGGLIVLNKSLVDYNLERKDLKVIEVRANEIADELGTLKVANMVALGAYLRETSVVKKESVFQVLEEGLTGSKRKLLDINKKALERGFNLRA